MSWSAHGSAEVRTSYTSHREIDVAEDAWILPVPCTTVGPEDVHVRFFRSVLFGLTTAVLAAAVWIVIKFVLPIAVPYFASRFGNDNVGGATAEITSGSILVALLLGFAAGFFWRFRRLPH